MTIIAALIQKIRQRPGLSFLVLLLIIITAGILKPNFYYIGWDNFSSYLNPSTNIFNTLFATWREHRGLGVPSDAEVNDLFRQIFDAFVSLFVGKKLADQLYMVGMLWGGVLGMYALGRYLSQRLGQNLLKQELFGSIAAFFYLFNLSTLAVFYFPMIMYPTRFFMLPTSVYILLNFIDRPYLPTRTYFLYLLLLFIGFGAYMVPTIFIVTMIMLALLVLVVKNKARSIAVLAFTIGLGMYWLLPFANYTVQKSAIVPEAPTFIEISESMLNKAKPYYSFERQAKLRPSFFFSQFHNITTNSQQYFHELANNDEKGLTRWALWIFPLTYLLGIIYVFIFKRDRILIWFALTTLAFLVLSMKEYSPLGLVYGFISDHMPFANTIFRFGDTKFHAMVAFAGSIMSAVFLVFLFDTLSTKVRQVRIWRYLPHVLAGLIIVAHLFVYKSYFNGNFIGFFMYNKVPSAYFDMAKIINDDPQSVRVIQLPFDSHSYWKPYSWGYFGSPFLHFMLNKPFFDRAFEPASMENADIHQKLISIDSLATSVPSDDLINKRALELYQTLRSLSVKYIIDDQTISTNIDARNIAYWGTINPSDSHRLLAYLEKNGYLKLAKRYEVAAKDYSDDYAKLYPYNKKLSNYTYPSRSIQLYELPDMAPRMQFLPEVDKVNSTQNLLSLPDASNLVSGHYLQTKQYDDQALVFPFADTQSAKQILNNQIKISLPIVQKPGTYTFQSQSIAGASATHILNVYAQKSAQGVTVYFEDPMFPTIESASNVTPKPLVSKELPTQRNDYQFIHIGDSVLPIASINDKKRELVGSVMVHGNSFPVNLIYPENTYNISNGLVQLEPNPQCFHDALDNAQSHITGDFGILKIWGQNVSNCLTTQTSITPKTTNQSDRTSFAQLEFNTMGTNENLPQSKYIDSGKPLLHQQITQLKNPLTMYVCVKASQSDLCLNKDVLFPITQDNKRFVVPIVGNLSKIDQIRITFAVRSNQRQKYNTTTTNVLLKTFVAGGSDTMTIISPEEYSSQYQITSPTKLNLISPIGILNPFQSLNLINEGMTKGDDSCNEKGAYQTIRVDNGGILSDVIGCRNFVQKNIPFSSNNFYTWLTTYQHLSGAIPTVLLMDKSNTYYYEKLNPTNLNANDYFTTPLQKPESLLTNSKKLTDDINSSGSYTISGYITPQFDLQDNQNKEFIMQHYSENEGLVDIKNISLIELPNYWSTSKIAPVDYKTLTFTTPTHLKYKRLLPSLWQVSADSVQASEPLLLFNEQYDKQWLVIKAKTLLHARCDGYANCYQIKLPQGHSVFYIFYIPELLNLLGFTFTAFVIIGGFLYMKKKNHAFSNVL